MPLREGTPAQEYLTPGDDRNKYGGPIQYDKGVEGVIDFMAAHDEKLEEKDAKELNELVDRYSAILKDIAQETEPLRLQELEAQKLEIRKELVGRRQFINQVERELKDADLREKVLTFEEGESLAVHPLRKEEGPENPSTVQAELSVKFYRMSMFCYDQKVEAQQLVIKLPDTLQAQYMDKVIAGVEKRNAVNAEVLPHTNVFRHPEQLSVEQWTSWFERMQDAFEDMIVLKREMEEIVVKEKEAKRISSTQ